MVFVGLLVRRFNSYYAARPSEYTHSPTSHDASGNSDMSNSVPQDQDDCNSRYTANYHLVLTTMITNAILGGIADTVAQSLTSIRQNAVRRPGGVGKDEFLAIEIHELDKRNPLNDNLLIPDSFKLPPPFDFERMMRFVAYAFLMTPVQHRWFGFLSRTFPLTKTSGTSAALKRVAFDQLLFAPVGE
jgi:hypothetical protein